MTLEAGAHVKEFRIETSEDIDNFEITIQHNGSGYLKINNVFICETRAYEIRHIVYLFFIFLLLDGIFLFGKTFQKHRVEVLFLLAVLFLVSLPEMTADFYYGHDIYFHLLRIEGIAREIRLGNFPAKIHSLCMDGYGSPVSVYYGDLFLYIPALLRIVGFSVVSAYKIYVFVINAGTVGLSYFCFKQIFRNQNVAMLGTLAYATCSYRMVNIYERAAVGEYTAMMVFPLVALAVYRIYTEPCEEWEEYRKNAWLLAFAMTGLISSHILSTEMVVWFLVIICVVLIKKTLRRNTLKVYTAAVFETLFLNAYFLVPFLDYYLNENVYVNENVEKGIMKVRAIQSRGAYIGQYFTFFGRVRGAASPSLEGRMQLSPGLVLMCALVVAFFFCIIERKRNRRCALYIFFSLLALFMASDIFPWDHLAVRFKLFDLLAQVQFPWRYIGIASIFLSLLLCEVLVWLKEMYEFDLRRMYVIIICACVFMTCYITGELYESIDVSGGMGTSFVLAPYDTVAVDTRFVAKEYVRAGTAIELLDGNIHSENAKYVNEVSRSGSRMVLYCETEKESAYIEVPFLNYKGYHVCDENGNEYEISDGKNNVISFCLPAHFKGNVIVEFKEPRLWRVAEMISLLFLLIHLGIWIRNYKWSGGA